MNERGEMDGAGIGARRRAARRAAWALFGTTLLGASLASAATIPVTTTNDENSASPSNFVCSLREAVIAANTDVAVGACPAGSRGPDTIVVPAGTYTLTLGGSGENASETGDLDLLDEVTIQGAGAASTIVHANGLDRAFEVRALTGAGVTLERVTVRGSPTEGISNYTGSLRVADAVVELNAGNGLTATDDVAVSGSTLRNNGAAAVYMPSYASVEVVDSVVEGNGFGSAPLAALFVVGELSVARTQVRSNVATTLVVAGGYLTMADSTIEANQPTAPGGQFAGVGALCSGWSCSPLMRLERTTVVANGGDGVFGFGDSTIDNCTVSGNTGDGLRLGAGITRLRNSTVAGNGALALENLYGGIWGPSYAELTNTLIQGGCYNEEGYSFLTSLGGNLESPGNTCKLVAASDQPSVADPKIGPLAMNGGLTKTHALLAGSPAIGHGNDAACLATDQRGVARPAPAGGYCDVGSYEYDTGCGASLEAAGAAPVALLLARRRRRRTATR